MCVARDSHYASSTLHHLAPVTFVFFAKRIEHDYSVHMHFKASVGSGYKTLADQLTNISHMPIDVDIKQLDDGDGIEATLMRHHTGWHKTFNQNNYKKALAHQLCTHVQVIALLILKMTSASFAISQLDLKVSTMHLHTTLMQCVIKLLY